MKKWNSSRRFELDASPLGYASMRLSMKLSLPGILMTMLLACWQVADAATYTNLTEAWCDETNNVIYNGKGYFAVESSANTSVDITISLDSLVSYVNSNDYKTGNYLLLWDDDVADYGLADNADTSLDNGKRTPYLSGYWNGSAWNAGANNISYSTLNTYAVNGSVTLNITNSNTAGVTVSTRDSSGNSVTLYTADTLKAGGNTVTNGYYVNLNYVTGVALNTASTLDTGSYVPPVDYSVPFESKRTDGTSLGRISFLGDSITHGVSDASYRWQFFKMLTDNGIENEIVGPREGYYNEPSHTEDAGDSYGGAGFANVHLAQASGRTHNIISGSTSALGYSSGVNYGGHSTSSTAAKFDSNTWFCMMGTNDLLSDTPNSGPSTSQYAAQMQKCFGGEVSYDSATDSYNWVAGDNWGTMKTIVDDVCKEGDTFYMLSITPWGNHSNHNRDMDHYAGAEFNRNMQAWCQAYSAASGKNVVYVDVTRGMVDVTSGNRNMGHDAFFNSSADRLHPNDQGAVLMAGNLARAMGIGGRTAGLQRQDTTGWDSAAMGTIAAGTSSLVAENAFTMDGGYTIDFAAVFGDGERNGWLSVDNALSISLGDGTNSGTLNITEGCIQWGSDVLFCWDNSTLADEGNIRIAWHNGNTDDNVLGGYYVWLDDMLIGQGLSAGTGQGLNGILISASGANGTIDGLSWTNTAYAPTTLGMVSAENAYYTVQNAAAVTDKVLNKAFLTSGVDYTGATEVSTVKTQIVTGKTATDTATLNYTLTGSSSWCGIAGSNYGGDINVELTGSVTNTVFGVMNASSVANLVLDIVEGASISGGTYSGQTGAIAGSYGGGNARSFNVYMQGGTISGDIVGGSIYGSGSIDHARIVVTGGTVNGNIYGGSKAEGTVGSADIVVTGGTITGGINLGGNAGIVGNTQLTVSGGTIQGNIEMGSARRTGDASSKVIIRGNTASIGGNITADQVVMENVSASQSDTGFDKYDGTVTAVTLTLSNVDVDLKSNLDIDNLVLISSSTSATLGEEYMLDSLELGDGCTFSAFSSASNPGFTSAQESIITVRMLSVGTEVTLNANLVFSADSTLILDGMLTMGSDVTLSTGMELQLSDSMLRALSSSGSVTLFSGVDNLILNDKALVDGTTFSAAEIFTKWENAEQYSLSYVNGDVTLRLIPEPATATLSLLALAGLVARRRRA